MPNKPSRAKPNELYADRLHRAKPEPVSSEAPVYWRSA